MSLLLLSVFAVSARSPLPDAESWCSSAIVLEADVVDASRSTATLAVVRTIKGRVEGEVRYEQPVGLAPLAVGDRVVVFASPHKRQASLVGEARPFVRNDSVTPPVMVAAAPAPLRRQVAVAALAPSPTAAVVHLYPQPVVAIFQPNLASLRAADAAGYGLSQFAPVDTPGLIHTEEPLLLARPWDALVDELGGAPLTAPGCTAPGTLAR